MTYKRLAYNAVDFFERGFTGNYFEYALLEHGEHAAFYGRLLYGLSR